MRLLPYEDFYINSPLTPAEIQIKLEQELLSPQPSLQPFGNWNGNNNGTAFFKGYAFNGIFEIERCIAYRNSFLPKIKGETYPNLQGSRVHIQMKLMSVILIFMCIWMSGTVIAFISMLISELNDSNLNVDILVPFGMFIFGYSLTTLSFKWESKLSKNKLLDLFEGQIE